MNTTSTPRFGRVRSRRTPVHIGHAGDRDTEVGPAEQPPEGTRAPSTLARSGAVLRLALVVSSLVAGVVGWLVASGASQPAEPELAVLLRGMAVLKGLVVAAASGLVWWRFGRRVTIRAAASHIVCLSSLCAATVFIWQLAFIAAAAVLFHAAGVVFLVVAWREGSEVLRFGRQAPNPSIEATAQSPLRALWPAPHVER